MAETNYRDEARYAARDMAENFLDEIIHQLEQDGEASKDLLNDYSGGDEYHHQYNVDKDYSLLEAAHLLDDLEDFEETDSGLWEGLEPRRAVAAQAAYTFGHAVMSYWQDLIGEINEKAGEEKFSVGPKDWSPKKKQMTIQEFVKKVIKEF
jgi:hypothetical protein